MDRYYLENWHTVILECLKFKDPCIANLETLTSYLSGTKLLDYDHMYFYVDFVTPGKNHFVVKYHGQNNVDEEDDDISLDSDQSPMAKLLKKKSVP